MLKEQKKYLKKWYNKTAEKYDTWEGKPVTELMSAEMQGIKNLLKIKKGNTVLDVATGTGNYLLLAAKKGAVCYGTDISPKMLKVAKRKAKKFKNVKELRLADADKLPYKNESFSWITCIGMLEYYPVTYAKKILLEFRRALKNKGRMIIDFPDKTDPEAKVFKRKSESVKTKVYLYDFKKILKVLKETGFKIQKKQKIGFEIQVLLVRQNI